MKKFWFTNKGQDLFDCIHESWLEKLSAYLTENMIRLVDAVIVDAKGDRWDDIGIVTRTQLSKLQNIHSVV